MLYIIFGYLLTAIAFLGLLFIDPMSVMTLLIIITVMIVGPVLFIIGVRKGLREQKKQRDMYTKITS